jgi:hypothetical protein
MESAKKLVEDIASVLGFNEPRRHALWEAAESFIEARDAATEAKVREEYAGLVKFAQDFVAKVDRGEARSVRSYAKAKAGLAALEGKK